MSSATEQRSSSVLSSIALDTMTEHDLLEVVEIEEESGLSRWGWSAYYAELQGNNRPLMLVARVARPLDHPKSYNLAGYIIARAAAGELHINNVAVREEFRRHKIGSDLLLSILETGRKLGTLTAYLEVRSGNLAAQALYERCGFKLIGTRPRYYSDPTEDAFVMSADLRQ